MKEVGDSPLKLPFHRYETLVNEGREVAQLRRATSQQPRHDGTSRYTLQGPLAWSDQQLKERGPWGSTRGVPRYRKTARYTRAVEELTRDQMRRTRLRQSRGGAGHRRGGRHAHDVVG